MDKLIGENIVEAIFIQENKNRFICTIEIKGKFYECYVPSSTRLSNYLNLDGKKVLVIRTNNPKSRTNFSLFALIQQKRLILLNLNLVNTYTKKWMYKNYSSFTIYPEKLVTKNYKADFYIEKKLSRKIVEVKALFCKGEELVYPKVKSDRLISQLFEIKTLLEDGFQVELLFVCLNKRISQVIISEKWENISNLFKECIEQGMRISLAEMITNKEDFFSLRIINRNINVIFESEKVS